MDQRKERKWCIFIGLKANGADLEFEFHENLNHRVNIITINLNANESMKTCFNKNIISELNPYLQRGYILKLKQI